MGPAARKENQALLLGILQDLVQGGSRRAHQAWSQVSRATSCPWYRESMNVGTQLAARLDEAVVARVDELVRAGRFDSRAEAVRRAVEALVEVERRRQVGEAIADGYRRLPQGDEEVAGAEASARAMIAEEPW